MVDETETTEIRQPPTDDDEVTQDSDKGDSDSPVFTMDADNREDSEE